MTNYNKNKRYEDERDKTKQHIQDYNEYNEYKNGSKSDHKKHNSQMNPRKLNDNPDIVNFDTLKSTSEKEINELKNKDYNTKRNITYFIFRPNSIFKA